MDVIRVRTEFNTTHISQAVEVTDKEGDIIGNFLHQVIALQDEGIEKALKELGWIPPEDSKQLHTQVRELFSLLKELKDAEAKG